MSAGKCSRCKTNKPIYKRGGGVYCGECLTLEKSNDEHIGIGNRFVGNGARGKSCKNREFIRPHLFFRNECNSMW